jgi:Zn-dependent protease/predicted transcriptional regulator
MNWSYRIFRVAGTDVKVHVTFLMLLAFYGLGGYQEGGSTGLLLSVGFALAVFTCVLLHEFGHILMARRFGVRTPDVILLPIGGVARLERMPDQPRQEFLIALAGPVVTLLIALGLYGYLNFKGVQTAIFTLDFAGDSPLALLMQINFMLLFFNLIPAFPMDGGRVLRALLAMRVGLTRATRIAATVGQFFAFAGGMYGLVNGQFMLVVIAFFVFLGAGAELTAVEHKAAAMGVRVGDMMMTRFRTIPVHARLEHAVQLLLDGDQRDFPVLDNEGRIEGMLSRDNLIKGLSARGPQSTVQEAMTARIPLLDPGLSFEEALVSLKSSGLPALPVVDPAGSLVGLLSLDNISELILVKRALQSK